MLFKFIYEILRRHKNSIDNFKYHLIIYIVLILQLNVTTIIILFCTVNLIIFSNYYGLVSIYGENNNNSNITEFNNNIVNNITVDDIDISYKKIGNGDPLLLIMGYSGSKNDWDPIFLDKLSENHTVIVFDNRGVGNTTNGTKTFSIEQFAEDTKGLLDALKINKSDVLGYSMGGMIAQELILQHPDKVDDLIIYASNCGTNQSFYPSPERLQQYSNLTGTEEDIKNRFVPYQFPDEWREKNYNHYNEIFASLKLPPKEILKEQINAMGNWTGTCNCLKYMNQDTLVVVGTDDQILPSKNSLLLTQKIPGAWLAQFKEGGHALMFQYPERLSSIVNTFLKD